jgi:hypothetical protein
MSLAQWMIITPSLEQEFRLETDAKAIMEDDQHDQIAELCASLSKQNWYQQQVIKQATAHIMELEAKIECYDFLDELMKEEERPSFWQRFFKKESNV